MLRGMLAGAALAFALAAGRVRAAAGDGLPAGLTVDRVVVLMRHGVRPPTKRWPCRRVSRPRLGRLDDQARLVDAARRGGDRAVGRGTGRGFAAGACCRVTAVRLRVRSESSPTATSGRSPPPMRWIAAVAPNCGWRASTSRKTRRIRHSRRSRTGRALSIRAPPIPLSPQRSAPAASRRSRRVIVRCSTRLDAILCGTAKARCGVGSERAGRRDRSTKRPKLSGALDRASTAAQILLLEYAEGKPMREVGWGRATAADIAACSALSRARVPAARAAAAIRCGPPGRDRPGHPRWADRVARAVTMMSGHDTNVANLGGLLDVHWRVPGMAMDDPAPGGRSFWSDCATRARLYVRATLSVADARADPVGAGAVGQAALSRDACRSRDAPALGVKGLCTLAEFEKKLGGPPHR